MRWPATPSAGNAGLAPYERQDQKCVAGEKRRRMGTNVLYRGTKSFGNLPQRDNSEAPRVNRAQFAAEAERSPVPACEKSDPLRRGKGLAAGERIFPGSDFAEIT
jgi:hypothetical protein